MVGVDSNYPDGTWSGSPDAPWNAVEPWERETCGTCRHAREGQVRGRRFLVCCDPEAAMVVDVQRYAAACENWEACF